MILQKDRTVSKWSLEAGQIYSESFSDPCCLEIGRKRANARSNQSGILQSTFTESNIFGCIPFVITNTYAFYQ